MASEQQINVKKTSVFLVTSEGAEARLIRANSPAAVRQYLLCEVKISKASGDDVIEALGRGGKVETVVSPTVPAAET